MSVAEQESGGGLIVSSKHSTGNYNYPCFSVQNYEEAHRADLNSAPLVFPHFPHFIITSLCYADSDTGIGSAHSFGTGFPPGVTVASTWNRKLMRARGFAIAESSKAKGLHVVLGPVLAFARTVGGDTNFEGFGNDPYLIGVAGYETVQGHQGTGVQAEMKQYIGYDGQQYNRTTYSSNIDSKTFHEVYLWPYAESLRANPACVMTSYNYVNNSYASQNADLLNDVLKAHLGFQGYVQTDWFGLKAGIAAVLSGLDQHMPGVAGNGLNWSFFGQNYTEGVRNGSIPEWRLTDATARIMTPDENNGNTCSLHQT
ncbi:hypothetical protein FE257_008822 [Aspergillus nanangensis]|uniref:beta-glucosidase n=1 Tax=Aspergillus nanangensis TaxID=2582783 RepID=A0AAD4GU96_ASPNN|nr:hypothetical protein FE257_008822 [Aspergillus nanangensis]